MLQVVLDEFGPCPIRISGIKHVQQHIRRIDNFVQFLPNSFRLTLKENSVLNFSPEIFDIAFMQILVDGRVILLMGLSCFRDELL